jgi:hypothetical protein
MVILPISRDDFSERDAVGRDNAILPRHDCCTICSTGSSRGMSAREA